MTDQFVTEVDLPAAAEEVFQHAAGWQHFLARLTRVAAGDHPGPDPWNQNRVQLRRVTGSLSS